MTVCLYMVITFNNISLFNYNSYTNTIVSRGLSGLHRTTYIEVTYVNGICVWINVEYVEYVCRLMCFRGICL